MKISPIELMVREALAESAKKVERQKVLDSICGDSNHVMVFNGVYRCFQCRVCGKMSKHEDGSDYGHSPWDDRD